ncbi:helix-turn-helix domain-containing protein [Micromonospora sp. NPDC005707]|uniref:helix-turn-helix domain-containing protein n=1 Tax=Micromonospora sp. NPDC005707 TaxID=3157050 RepID=UPI0033CB4C31
MRSGRDVAELVAPGEVGAGVALRCRIVNACAGGLSSQDVAARSGVSRPTVGKRRSRFVACRLRREQQPAQEIRPRGNSDEHPGPTNVLPHSVAKAEILDHRAEPALNLGRQAKKAMEVLLSRKSDDHPSSLTETGQTLPDAALGADPARLEPSRPRPGQLPELLRQLVDKVSVLLRAG